MATIKAVSSRASIGNAINYVTKTEKTEEKICEYLNCSSSDPIQAMKETKELWGKTDGRQYYHFVQSWSAEEQITPELAHKIGVETARKIWGEAYEVVVATHIDREHIHNHIVVNSVSWETGKKFNNTRNVLRSIKDYSDELCAENGLSITVKGKHFDGTDIVRGDITTGSTEMYREAVKNDGWLQDMYNTVMLSARRSESREEFVQNCSEHGITVNWEDNRKYITFVDDEGHKARDKKLGETFNMDLSKEGLTKLFDQNIEQGRAVEEVIREAQEPAVIEISIPPKAEAEVIPSVSWNDFEYEDIERSLYEPIEPVKAIREEHEVITQKKGLVATIAEKIEDFFLKVKEITEEMRDFINGRIKAISESIGRTEPTISKCRNGVIGNRSGIEKASGAYDQRKQYVDRTYKDAGERKQRVGYAMSCFRGAGDAIRKASVSVSRTERYLDKQEPKANELSRNEERIDRRANITIRKFDALKLDSETKYIEQLEFMYAPPYSVYQIPEGDYFVRDTLGRHLLEVQNLKTMEIEYIRDFGNGEWANEEGHVAEYFERNGLTLGLDEEGKPIASHTGTGWGDYNKVREVLDNIYAKPEPEIEEPEPPTHHRGGWDLSR